MLIWDVGTRQERERLRGHSGSITVMACAPDCQTLAGSSRDTIKLWQLPPIRQKL